MKEHVPANQDHCQQKSPKPTQLVMASTVCFSDPPPTCLGKDSGTHLVRGSLPLQLLLLELGLARHVRGGGERPHRRLQSRLHSFMIQCTWEVTLRCTLHNRGCQCNEASLFSSPLSILTGLKWLNTCLCFCCWRKQARSSGSSPFLFIMLSICNGMSSIVGFDFHSDLP